MSDQVEDQNMFILSLIEDHIETIKTLEKAYPGLLLKLKTGSLENLSTEFGLSKRKIQKFKDRFGIGLVIRSADQMKVGGVYVVKEEFIDAWNNAESPQMVADKFGISASPSSNPRAALCSAATILRKKGFELKKFERGRPRLRKPSQAGLSI